MKEVIWKPIKGYESLYEVSSNGVVKSLKSNVLLKVKTSSTGRYPSVNLFKTGKFETKKVHRLVAEAFILNIDKKPCVNHKDSNRQNNCASNLEWVTYKENTVHAYKLGRLHVFSTSQGESAPGSKLKEKQVLEIISLIKKGGKRKDLAKTFNVCESTIDAIANNQTWKYLDRNLTVLRRPHDLQPL